MHVLYTAFDLVPNPKGAGTHIMHFLQGLVNAGHTVQLITPGDGQPARDRHLRGGQRDPRSAATRSEFSDPRDRLSATPS